MSTIDMVFKAYVDAHNLKEHIDFRNKVITYGGYRPWKVTKDQIVRSYQFTAFKDGYEGLRNKYSVEAGHNENREVEQHLEAILLTPHRKRIPKLVGFAKEFGFSEFTRVYFHLYNLEYRNGNEFRWGVPKRA